MNLCFSVLRKMIFIETAADLFNFNHYLAVLWPTLGHSREDSFTNPMLIYNIDPKVTGSLVTRLGR